MFAAENLLPVFFKEVENLNHPVNINFLNLCLSGGTLRADIWGENVERKAEKSSRSSSSARWVVRNLAWQW